MHEIKDEKRTEIITNQDSPQICVWDVDIDSSRQIIRDKTIKVVGRTLEECKRVYNQLVKERN